MHQDNYAYTVPHGGDGAPYWATPRGNYNDTIPDWKIQFFEKIGLPWQPTVAFEQFWANVAVPETGRGLQDHYIHAFGEVARRFVNEPAVLGYEASIHTFNPFATPCYRHTCLCVVDYE